VTSEDTYGTFENGTKPAWTGATKRLGDPKFRDGKVLLQNRKTLKSKHNLYKLY